MKKLFTFSITILISLMLINCSSKKETKKSKDVDLTSVNPEFTLTVKELAAASEKKAEKGYEKYQGKIIQISGYVFDKGKTAGGDFSLHLCDEKTEEFPEAFQFARNNDTCP